MRNCIRWKKDEVGGRGGLRMRMSSGSGDFMQSVLFWQTRSLQHSLSAQSTSPSVYDDIRAMTLKGAVRLVGCEGRR
jgi:hypothetical protein